MGSMPKSVSETTRYKIFPSYYGEETSRFLTLLHDLPLVQTDPPVVEGEVAGGQDHPDGLGAELGVEVEEANLGPGGALLHLGFKGAERKIAVQLRKTAWEFRLMVSHSFRNPCSHRQFVARFNPICKRERGKKSPAVLSKNELPALQSLAQEGADCFR